MFGGHQSISGGRRSIGRAGLTAETGKGLSGLQMAGITFSHIENVIGLCVGVTSPFREVGGQSGPTGGPGLRDQIARRDRKRTERPGNGWDNVFTYKK